MRSNEIASAPEGAVFLAWLKAEHLRQKETDDPKGDTPQRVTVVGWERRDLVVVCKVGGEKPRKIPPSWFVSRSE